MAIDLLNRLTQTQMNKTVSGQSAKNVDSAEAARILRSVYALKAGDTLQGELILANGKDITLLLGESVFLNARMDKELMLSPGQLMSFTVSSNQNGKLSLQPLFANTGMEQNAMKALDEAGIPVTDKTLALTEEMMRQGLPVNKQSLLAACRQMGMFPDADIVDLVMLHKMEIPVTEENLSMMQLYRTNQHYLFSDLQSLSNQMVDFLTDMAQTQPADGMAAMVRGFLGIFRGTQHVNGDGQPPEQMQNSQSAMTEIPPDGLGENGSGNRLTTQEAALTHTQTTRDGKTIIQDSTTLQDVFSGNESVAAGEDELLLLLSREGIKREGNKELLGQNLFSLLKDHFLMKPQDMQSADYVREFYEKLNEQVEKLQELVKSVGKEGSAFGKELNTVKSNIQFMNQINEMYHYVQLPIKMNEEGTNGDLYVYKRKQARTGDDGKLTALLHLSMPVLGNMDVFLSLEEQKLSTRFCMEKEEMIDFIEAHIEQLNERLVKRGYQVQTSVTAGTKAEEKSVVDEIMTTQPSIPILTSKSFDARC